MRLAIQTVLATALIAAGGGLASAQNADTLKMATPFKTTTLDPIRSAAAGNIETFGQLYSRLLRRDSDGQLQPGLAESWEMSEDGKTYTFELRDAKFSDGTAITAEDVAFSLDRGRTHKESAYPAPFQAIESVEAVDADTVRINLGQPSAPFLAYMEIFNAGIVSKDDVEERGEETAFTEDPVASGPYMVEEWKPQDRLILKKNPHYWRTGYPKIARVEIIEVADANARSSMVQAGEVDAVRVIPWAQVDELKTAEKIDVPLEPSTQINIVLLNHKREPFSSKEIRKAAALALDRAAVTDAVTLGHATATNTTLPASLEYVGSDFPEIPHDPEKARQLIEDAGMTGREVIILIAPGNEQPATLLQAQWAAVGLKPKIEKIDAGGWWDRIISGDYDAAPNWWYNETEDPDLAVRWALCGECGNNSYYTNFNNERINELTKQAVGELDPEKRREMYREIQEISIDEVAQIPLYDAPFANAYSTRIKGLKLTPSLQWTLEEAEIAE